MNNDAATAALADQPLTVSDVEMTRRLLAMVGATDIRTPLLMTPDYISFTATEEQVLQFMGDVVALDLPVKFTTVLLHINSYSVRV